MARDARRSTLVEIAADAGVSVSAVSKVLNGRTDVAAGTGPGSPACSGSTATRFPPGSASGSSTC